MAIFWVGDADPVAELVSRPIHFGRPIAPRLALVPSVVCSSNDKNRAGQAVPVFLVFRFSPLY